MEYQVQQITYDFRNFQDIEQCKWNFTTSKIYTNKGSLDILDFKEVEQNGQVGVQMSVNGWLDINEYVPLSPIDGPVNIKTLAVMRRPHNVWLWVYMFDEEDQPIAAFCGIDCIDGFAKYVIELKRMANGCVVKKSDDKEKDSANKTLLRFGRDLPFSPEAWDVFYVEDKYNPSVNEYITEHYDEICRKFSEKCWVFNYLPKIANQPVSPETLQYMFPYFKSEILPVSGSISVEMLMQHLVVGKISGPSLIRLKPFVNKGTPPFYDFYCLTLDTDSVFPLAKQIDWYLKQRGFYYYDDGVRYSLAPPEGDDVADACFNDGDAESYSEYYPYMHMDPETTMLVKEIRDKVNELRKRGFQMGLLRNLIEEKPTLSRLVVDNDFRIFLPDYNNIEITMQPLHKAVYLLFLKHPEGIRFKALGDYYDELLAIYRQVGNREIEKNIKNSIRDITDPSKNSINEKCTRIREAFLSKFDYVYAQYYFITGKRGEPKKIALPRELIVSQAL